MWVLVHTSKDTILIIRTPNRLYQRPHQSTQDISSPDSPRSEQSRVVEHGERQRRCRNVRRSSEESGDSQQSGSFKASQPPRQLQSRHSTCFLMMYKCIIIQVFRVSIYHFQLTLRSRGTKSGRIHQGRFEALPRVPHHYHCQQGGTGREYRHTVEKQRHWILYRYNELDDPLPVGEAGP